MLINLLFLLFISAQAAEMNPLNDNILFAFDKCKTISVDLNKTALVETVDPAFDIHCLNNESDKLLFRCDFFDVGSKNKKALEALTGGRDGKIGQLSNKGGTTITFSLEKGTAAFDSPVASKELAHPARKVCAGIFIFEKEALKKKK